MKSLENKIDIGRNSDFRVEFESQILLAAFLNGKISLEDFIERKLKLFKKIEPSKSKLSLG